MAKSEFSEFDEYEGFVLSERRFRAEGQPREICYEIEAKRPETSDIFFVQYRLLIPYDGDSIRVAIEQAALKRTESRIDDGKVTEDECKRWDVTDC